MLPDGTVLYVSIEGRQVGSRYWWWSVVKYVITVGETESLQAPLEVEDGEVPHKLLLTLGAFEHSQFSSIHYAVSVLQLFSTEIFNILFPGQSDGLSSVT